MFFDWIPTMLRRSKEDADKQLRIKTSIPENEHKSYYSFMFMCQNCRSIRCAYLPKGTAYYGGGFAACDNCECQTPVYR